MADDQVYCAETGGVGGKAERAWKRFKARFNTDVQVYAPYVYDAVNLMVSFMVKAHSAAPEKYPPVLAATTDYQGILSLKSNAAVRKGVLLDPFSLGCRDY